MNEITIKDAGPIDALTIPCEPGYTVLRGPNDEGKSEALKLCDRLSGGKQKVAKRHDAAGAGSVEGFGARITLGGSVRQAGQLEAYSLSGRFDISELIQPPVKDPVAADKVRMRAFLQLTGAEADITLFRPLYEAACITDIPESIAIITSDLVEMASLVKGDMESIARSSEAASQVAEGKAAACKEATEGVDLTGESDAVVLQTAVEAAVAERARTDELYRSITEAKDRSINAKGILDKAESEYSGLSESAASDLVEARSKTLEDAHEKINALESKLSDANVYAEQIEQEHITAVNSHSNAKLHEDTIARCRKAIDESANVGDLTTEEMQAAVDALAIAHEAVKQGALIRNAKEAIALRECHLAKSLECKGKATALRLSARETETILSNAVQSAELTVKDGRLITMKDGKEVFFADRSRGYRCRVAMTIAADQIRKAGAEKAALIVLPQEHWEGLDIDARIGLAKQAKKLGVCVITAEASSREGDPKTLTATTFGE